MKLVAGGCELPHSRFGKGEAVLRDMQHLYSGGKISSYVNSQRQRIHYMTTGDEQVRVSNQGRHATETTVSVAHLEHPLNAARWLALQAYRAAGGVLLQTLATEVSGTLACREWEGRQQVAARAAADRVSTEYDTRAAALLRSDTPMGRSFDRQASGLETERVERRREAIYAAYASNFTAATRDAAGGGPLARLYGDIATHNQRAGAALDEATRAAAAGDQTALIRAGNAYYGADSAREGLFAAPLEEGPHTHTVFHATGDGLPAAARVMAEGYGELTFHTDDPERAVLSCLGASSLGGLSELDSLWRAAAAQPTPLEAGRLVLSALTA